jgi:hypothetical protein
MTPCYSIIYFRYSEGNMFIRNVENKLLMFQKNAILKIHENLKDRQKLELNFLLDSCDRWFYIKILFGLSWYWSIENCWDLWTFKNPASYIYDGHTVTLQMLHFIHLFQQL